MNVQILQLNLQKNIKIKNVATNRNDDIVSIISDMSAILLPLPVYGYPVNVDMSTGKRSSYRLFVLKQINLI